MKQIAQISDLHFDHCDPIVSDALLRDLEQQKPAVVVVSGDLTQRARESQFVAARAFLDRIAAPKVVVPGNHDVPLFDLARRFLSPFDRFRRIIEPNEMPSYQDSEVAIIGINTARSMTWKNGRISVEQIDRLERSFARVPTGVFKVLVTHHPFCPPPDDPGASTVGRADRALAALEHCGVELLLAGHLHASYTSDASLLYEMLGRSVMVAQAGTAISTRHRGEVNGYNMISIAVPELTVAVRRWNGHSFEAGRSDRFVKNGRQWQRRRQEAHHRSTEI